METVRDLMAKVKEQKGIVFRGSTARFSVLGSDIAMAPVTPFFFFHHWKTCIFVNKEQVLTFPQKAKPVGQGLQVGKLTKQCTKHKKVQSKLVPCWCYKNDKRIGPKTKGDVEVTEKWGWGNKMYGNWPKEESGTYSPQLFMQTEKENQLMVLTDQGNCNLLI